MSLTGALVNQAQHYWIKSLTPGRVEWKFRQVIFKLISVINGWGIFCEMTPRRMSLDLTDDKSTLVQVMAWCRQAKSHCLSQYWPSSICRHLASLGHNELIHPKYQGQDDCFVLVPTPPDIWSHDNFQTTFHISFNFGRISGPGL